ncbi:MAG: hypothetical protein ACQEWV_14125 [Bacillota bacterium]
MKVYYVGDGSVWHRHRIGNEVNGMFEFNEFNIEEVAQTIFYALTEAEEWWISYPNWWNK